MSSQKDDTLLAGYTYAYLLDGNIVEKSDNTGITTDYVYNNAGMLTSETVRNALEQIQNTAYSYDNRGNRTGVIGTGNDEYTETYTYDLNNRLTNLSKVVYNEYDHPDNIFSTRYNYDFNGNLFSENTSAIGKSLENPSVIANAFGTGSVGWDSKTGLTFYNYNVNNQLTSVVKDGKTATYTYNPDGYRSSKTVDGVTTNHIWNGTQIVLETDSTDAVIAEYIYGAKRIYNEQNGVKSYYLYDAHGDTKQLTDSLGAITWDYTYDAFGNEVDLTDGIIDTTTIEPYNPFRYCGEYYDTETGFIYLRARYYSPEIGRFVSEDPIADGLNWYAYCGNNPIALIDPLGLEYVIVSGGDYSDDSTRKGYSYNFIEPAIKKIRELRASNSEERISWCIASSGWSQDDWKNFNDAVADLNVDIIVIDSADELTNYINYCSTTGRITSPNGTINERAEDKITKFVVFAHGWAGVISLGYNYNNDYDKSLDFGISNIDDINPEAFDNPNSWFYSCNAATDNENCENFLNTWYNSIGGFAGGYAGKTTYEFMTYSESYSKYWAIDRKKWNERSNVHKMREKYGFSDMGSLRYPTGSIGVDQVTHGGE